MAKKIIYVQQFDYFWKLTEAQWREICALGISGEGYNLPSSGALKKRPGKVIGAVIYDDGRKSYFTRTNDVLLYEPLDWEQHEYTDALNDLNDLKGST
jgi:hypothetical protein